jgi:nucleotide-binding universal stress UspA family protein
MSESISELKILVPIDASEPGEPSQSLVDVLHPHRLVVLGYYPVPDQSSTDQVRSQFGEEAADAIDDVANRFDEHGKGVESAVVFTHDRSKTIDNVADKYDVDAVLTAGHVGETLNRILVPLRGDDNLERILGFVGVLLRESDAVVTVFNVSESGQDASRGELLVRGACERLEDEEGIEPDRIDWDQAVDRSATNAISEAAADYDLLIVGESKPSLTERILGDVTDQVIDQSSEPLLIVRDR